VKVIRKRGKQKRKEESARAKFEKRKRLKLRARWLAKARDKLTEYDNFRCEDC